MRAADESLTGATAVLSNRLFEAEQRADEAEDRAREATRAWMAANARAAEATSERDMLKAIVAAQSPARRALHEQLGKLESERDTLAAEVAALREALQEIQDASLADFVRACEVVLAEEQRGLGRNPALIGLLCDAVRLAREPRSHEVARLRKVAEAVRFYLAYDSNDLAAIRAALNDLDAKEPRDG